MNLDKSYDRSDFLKFIKSFIPDFELDITRVDEKGLKVSSNVSKLGESNSLDLEVYELSHSASSNARISLASDGFRIMKDAACYRALIVYRAADNQDWRLSLLTATPININSKVNQKYSNPRRYSFFLGPNARIKTPHKFLIQKGVVDSFEDLQNRFSVEVVNKEFYQHISSNYEKLIGGIVRSGRKKTSYESVMSLPSQEPHSQTSVEFAVRLIGRIIFCWFLREKKSHSGISLIPKELLSLNAVKNNPDYYHKILEPIFFEVLNKPLHSRKERYQNKPYSLIPYLNGGLFSPQFDDFYDSINEGKQVINHNTVIIPNNWFLEFFRILEIYNFTIDENTSFDEELSIDPEMLGRIFENLLAEINPETGESARKSTGSYYTPRSIVNHMVDESLFLYLKNQTTTKENILREIIDYDPSNIADINISKDDRKQIIDAIEKLKLIDLACGSGAFPIGALQKIVFILQQIDPHGQLWFREQLSHLSPELRRVVRKEYERLNFDYIRKLGVIRANIYGVDIQPIATEIARLRCFLTLIVDQSIVDNEKNRNIQYLPNLDFKFVTANSLFRLTETNSSPNELEQMEMYDDRDSIDELKVIRDQYFSATGIEREQLKTEFVTKQKEMVKQLIKEHGYIGIKKADITQKLTDWEPFSHTASNWFDPDWMFGIKEGFDIVIGNPPWGAKLEKNEKKNLKRLYPKIDSSTPNSFAYFVGISHEYSKGVITLILPDSILIKDFSKTRKLMLPFITEISWYQNTGMPKTKKPFLFVEHDVCVIISNKIKKEESKIILNKFDSKKKSIIPITEIKNKKDFIFSDFDYAFNLLVNTSDLIILNKLMAFDRLDKETQCHEGIHSGNIRSKLFIQENRNKYCKPLFLGAGKGGDEINNYVSNRSGWFVDYREEIIDRGNGEYASLRDERLFKNPKIYISRTGDPFKAFFDEKSYASNNFFSLQVKDYDKNFPDRLKILIPFITSKVTHYFIRKFAAPRLGNTFVETKIIHLLKIRIPKLSNTQEDFLLNMVNSICSLIAEKKHSDVKIIETRINEYIFEIYGLSDKDIATINSFTN